MQPKHLWASLLFILTTILVATSQSADEDKDRKGKAVDEQRALLLNILASPIDLTVASDDAVLVVNKLRDEINGRYADIPGNFKIRLDGNALRLEGITRNQRIQGLEVKDKSVADVLTAFVVKMNPIRTGGDPTSRDQKVVWTIGPDPDDADKNQVILITIRDAAIKRGLSVPKVFLSDDVRAGRLKLTGVSLHKNPAGTDERNTLLLNILASRMDFTVKSGGAFSTLRDLEDGIREHYAEIPEHFGVRIDGSALRMEGITKNQRIPAIDVKQKSFAEILTLFVVGMNPIRNGDDPSSRDQKVVWTIGPDPKDADGKQVILVTTRGVALQRGLSLPEVFLLDDAREGRLKLKGVQLQKKPDRKNGAKKIIKTTTGLSWSEVISAETLEDEIKAIKLRIDKNVTTPTRFAGGDYKICRVEFNELAVLFAVAGVYDENVRWQEDAPVARDVFARAAKDCKVGATSTFQQAKLRKNELADLVASNGIKARDGNEPEHKVNWPDVSDRVPLMLRMDSAFSKTLKVDAVDAMAFGANKERIRHEAEIIALNAEVIVEEGQPDADDHEYKLHALAVSSAARRLSSAAKANDFDEATAAITAIERSCAQCHEAWR